MPPVIEFGAIARRFAASFRWNALAVSGLVACLAVTSADPASAYRRRHRSADEGPRAEKKEPQRSGPLFAIISIRDQHVSFYGAEGLVERAPVSTGQPGHRTPTGVFSIIQKQVFHRSNIYSGAPMPYMQRITWSGVAMHAGVLPGYPASHGCIRMPHSFAKRIYGMTKMGQRVLVAPHDIVPSGITHDKLPVPVMHAVPQQDAAAPASGDADSKPEETAAVGEGAQSKPDGALEPAALTVEAPAVKQLNPIEYAWAMRKAADAKGGAAVKAVKETSAALAEAEKEAREAARAVRSAEAAVERLEDELAGIVRRIERFAADEEDAKRAMEASAEAGAAMAEAEKALAAAREAKELKDRELEAAREAKKLKDGELDAVREAEDLKGKELKAAREAKKAKDKELEAAREARELKDKDLEVAREAADKARSVSLDAKAADEAARSGEKEGPVAAEVAEGKEDEAEAAAGAVKAKEDEAQAAAGAVKAREDEARAAASAVEAKEAEVRAAAEAVAARKDEVRAAAKAEDAKNDEVRDAAKALRAAETALKTAERQAAVAARRAARAEEEKADAERARAKQEEAKAVVEAKITEARQAVEEAGRTRTVKDQEFEAADKAARAAETVAEKLFAQIKEATRRLEPVSLFISRKTGRLYVRQAFKPVFNVPVTIKDPERPIGTHVYVALDAEPDGSGLKWSAVSLPDAEPDRKERRSERRRRRVAEAREPAASDAMVLPPENPAGALDRIEIPEAAAKRIAELAWIGATLIISDRAMSGETNDSTDFIIKTRGH